MTRQISGLTVHRGIIAAGWKAAAAIALLFVSLMIWAPPARADVTAADLADQPAVMKQDCRNRLGKAGNSQCQTDAAYVACLAYLKAGRWDYCLRGGDAGSQARRSTAADARSRLVAIGCAEIGSGQFRCPDVDFNRSLAYTDCVAFRNGGSVMTCLRRDFLTEYADRIDARLRLNRLWAMPSA